MQGQKTANISDETSVMPAQIVCGGALNISAGKIKLSNSILECETLEINGKLSLEGDSSINTSQVVLSSTSEIKATDCKPIGNKVRIFSTPGFAPVHLGEENFKSNNKHEI